VNRDTTEEQQPSKRRQMLPSGFATLRDAFLFVLGIVIICYEAFAADKIEPYVLAVGLAMTGLPVVFGADERRKGEAQQ